MLKILLIGPNGQLGSDLRKTNPGHELLLWSHGEADITDGAAVTDRISRASPQVVINTAAYHRVDDCEEFPEKALQVNILGARLLAKACRAVRARLVHYSTDYVFDGKKKLPYRESDKPAPLNIYGVSKLGGEHAVLAAGEEHIVIRTASLFGTAGSSGKGGNFVETVIKKSRDGLACEIVDDMIMSPTYTRDLAAMTWTLLEKQVPGGLYHVANAGTCSWFEFTRKIFSLLGLKTPLSPIRSADRSAKAVRPMYSALASERMPELKIQPLRLWQEAVQAYLLEKGHLN